VVVVAAMAVAVAAVIADVAAVAVAAVVAAAAIAAIAGKPATARFTTNPVGSSRGAEVAPLDLDFSPPNPVGARKSGGELEGSGGRSPRP